MYKLLMALIVSGLYSVYGAEYTCQELLQVYEQYSLAPQNLRQMKQDSVVVRLKALSEKSQAIQLQNIGSSAEGRTLYKISFGKGSTKILLWSQMHGDEPTATAALLAVFNFLAAHTGDKEISDLHKKVTIHAVPMLNPDGAESYQRWNAQDIDVNRDARALTTPEGQVLKKLQEEIKPDYGFNLHDMGGREMVDENKNALYLAFMAPPYNKEDEDNATRTRAKQLIVYLKNRLDPFIGGHIARYKADYMPRAFGDAMQNWGVSTVLIESGLNDTPDPHFLVRLNFAALLSAFQAIASDIIEREDPAHYEKIPLEGIPLFDLVLRDVLIYNGTGLPPFRSDIGINIETKQSNQKEIKEALIEEIGDLSLTTGLEVIEGDNLVAVPGFILRAKQSFDRSDLLKQGVTTAVIDSSEKISRPDEIWYFIPSIPEEVNKVQPGKYLIPVDQIPTYTFLPAKVLNLKELGQIKRKKQADVLIFDGVYNDHMELSRLIYVIKNGVVVKVGE